VPGGLRNVVYTVRGRDPERYVVVGAHYDTKDYPGFVGANDGASGTAVVYELARALRPGTVRPTVVFVFFDGEEAPDDSSFEQNGMRGSRVAAQAYKRAQAMVLLDMIGDRNLGIPREQGSSDRLFARVRASASRVGAGRVFAGQTGTILDDHVPFARAGVPSVDLIDFTFPCWHKSCDDLSAVSATSLDVVGETVADVLRGF
jgi:Zn-dependent M28 family amino/carboxypeptidase